MGLSSSGWVNARASRRRAERARTDALDPPATRVPVAVGWKGINARRVKRSPRAASGGSVWPNGRSELAGIGAEHAGPAADRRAAAVHRRRRGVREDQVEERRPARE